LLAQFASIRGIYYKIGNQIAFIPYFFLRSYFFYKKEQEIFHEEILKKYISRYEALIWEGRGFDEDLLFNWKYQ
jgi:hypothetical protein